MIEKGTVLKQHNVYAEDAENEEAIGYVKASISHFVEKEYPNIIYEFQTTKGTITCDDEVVPYTKIKAVTC